MAKARMDGERGEHNVCQLLIRNGRQVQRGRYNEPFDILVDGKTHIEVKTCRSIIKRGQTAWFFNIHRHGVLDEQGVDAYIFRLENVPETSAAIHLLFKAPLGILTVVISIRSLLNRYGVAMGDFRKFAKTGQL